ncbi:unannotated protein [freshwater metagenome]|uniref:Unannotated protein n=1 Tax=freshwater metagenome TaxID=449393 RepID=A0A6J7IQQ8_9ZZZZ|nr:hypothetical protein [Actinomycetota bacterium]
MAPVLASYEFGDGILIALTAFVFIVWFWILVTILMDLFRDHELSGGAKALWLLMLVFIPVISALIYLIARGDGMRQRAIAQQQEMQQATDSYIKSVAGSSTADEIAKLAALKDSGALSQAEFDAAKAKLVS